MSLNKLEFGMAIPAITRAYTAGSCRNKRKPMRLPACRKLRPDFPALGAQQFRVPNRTRKEPWFA